jgi:hypothetical protein
MRVTVLAAFLALVPAAQAWAQTASDPDYIGVQSTNLYLQRGTSNPVSAYDYRSPANPYGPYGSRYSPTGARNPYAVDGARLYSLDGTYLGRLNANRYDPESVSNPYGRYGSPYSSTSVNNPYGQYGSPYSNKSARNPFATDPPRIYEPPKYRLWPRRR